MVTKFYIVPATWMAHLYWFGFLLSIVMCWWYWRARATYMAAATIIKERTAELETALQSLQRDSETLSKEIEEVRKLRLP